MTKIAFVGTGFVADYYMTTLQNHPGLQLAGVWDRDAARLSQFCDFHGAQRRRRRVFHDFSAIEILIVQLIQRFLGEVHRGLALAYRYRHQ